MNKANAPKPEDAKQYVHEGIHGVGGIFEGLAGLWHKTIPTFIGSWGALTFFSVVALLFRILLVCSAAIFPLILRKLSTPQSQLLTQNPAGSTPATVQDALGSVLAAIQSATPTDYLLGAVAVFLVGFPKVLDMFGKEPKAGHHTPFTDLTAAIRQVPVKEKISTTEVSGAIRLTLLALKEEMSLLIGARSSSEVTDIALLEFCDSEGKRMQVRARTASNEETNRPNDASRFVAYYVALEGRNFAEHNFTNRRNPFPATRVSVRGGHKVNYKSVLYMPMIVSKKKAATAPDKPEQVVDYCVGVICIHSSKAFRFWRWGDHKKGTGGFADVAFSRALPYIAIVEQLLNRTAHKLELEAK